MRRVWRYIKSRLRGEEPLSRLIKRGLVVGEDFHMGTGCTIDSAHCWLITIGNNVKLAPHVHILAHDAGTKSTLGYTRIGRVDIGDNVLVGAHSIILPGVRIGSNVGIASGSVVARDVPDNTCVGGNPARRFSTMDAYIDKYREMMETGPVYDERYTTRGGITPEMKQEMKDALAGGISGFVD